MEVNKRAENCGMKVFWPVRLLSTAICGAVLLFFLVSLEGCSEKEPMISEFSDVPIAFISEDNWDALNADAAVGTRDGESTRSAVDTRDGEGATAGTAVPFDDGSEIGVFSYYNPAEGAQKQFMFNEQVTFDGTIWTYEPVKYWPHSGSLDFYAYYPYKAGTAIHTIDIENHYTDYRWATPLTGRTEGPVAFVFHHALACIRLNVKSTAITGVKMKEVTFNDSKGKIPSGGKMNIESGAITGSAEVASIDFKEFKTEVILSSDAYQTSELYIPAYSGLVDKQFNISFMFDIDNNAEDNYEPVSFALPAPANNEYTVGKRYTYNLDLKEDKTVEIVSIVIDEYEKEESADVVVGKKDILIDNTYYVSSADYLVKVVKDINENPALRSRNITLMNDIDLENVNWKPLGNGHGYKGIFEGDNHTLYNLTVTDSVKTLNLYKDWANLSTEDAIYECYGLIGYLNGGIVQNVELNNVTINQQAKHNNSDIHVAPVVAICSGVIKNCHVKGTTNLTAKAHASALNAYDGRIGGITSLIYSNSKSNPIIPTGYVIGCSVSGSITASIEDNQYSILGGIAGYVYGNGGKIIACYLNGDIKFSIKGKAGSGNAANIGGIVSLSEAMGMNSPMTTLIASYINASEDSYMTIIESESVQYNGHNTGAVGALFQLTKPGTPSQVKEDDIRACYWNKTTNITAAYGRPTEAEETASGASAFNGKNQMFEISTTTWHDAANNMNNAINTYNSNASGNAVCDFKYDMIGSIPVLVPNKQ